MRIVRLKSSSSAMRKVNPGKDRFLPGLSPGGKENSTVGPYRYLNRSQCRHFKEGVVGIVGVLDAIGVVVLHFIEQSDDEALFGRCTVLVFDAGPNAKVGRFHFRAESLAGTTASIVLRSDKRFIRIEDLG